MQSWHAHGSETGQGGGTQDLRDEANWCGVGDIRIETESVGSLTSTLTAFQRLMLGLVGGEAPEGF